MTPTEKEMIPENEIKTCIVIGESDINDHISQLIKDNPNVEIITIEQAKERGLTVPNSQSFDIKPIPILKYDYTFQAPLTRAQRRKNERKNN